MYASYAVAAARPVTDSANTVDGEPPTVVALAKAADPDAVVPAFTWATDGADAPLGTTTMKKSPLSLNWTSTVKPPSDTALLRGNPDTNVGGDTSAPVVTDTFVAEDWVLGVASSSRPTAHTSYAVLCVSPDAVDVTVVAADVTRPDPDATGTPPDDDNPSTT